MEVQFAAGQAQIELFSFPSPPVRPSWPEVCGLRHRAFTVEALEPVVQRLRRCQVSQSPSGLMITQASALPFS
jgi:glyoxylase I family protein